MSKLERVYNWQIDIVPKRKELYWLKMLFNKLTNMSLFHFGMVLIHKDASTRCFYCIFYGSRNKSRLWKESLAGTFRIFFTVKLEPLGSKAASTLFHIVTRQLRWNVKAYSRNIGWSHSSVQWKKHLSLKEKKRFKYYTNFLIHLSYLWFYFKYVPRLMFVWKIKSTVEK